MNKSQFLKALRKTPRDWRRSDNTIRRGQYEDFCPITAVIVARKQECVDVGDAADYGPDLLNISLDLAQQIIKAADNDTFDGTDCEDWKEKNKAVAALRVEMLAACGLKKRKA